MKSTRRNLLVLATMLLSIALAPPAIAETNAFLPFENFTEDIGRGFGSNWNRYAFSMNEFNNQVYVGTWNVQFDYPALIQALKNGSLGGGSGNPLEGIGFLTSKGAEIWRHDGGQNWTMVHKAPTEDNTGFRKMFNYGGLMYVGSANSTTGAEIMSSTDGTTWTPVNGWAPNPGNNSIRTFAEYQGKLWVGTENNATGAELWSYDGKTSEWKKEKVFDQDSSVAELLVYNNKLHVGTWDFTDSFKLYSSSDGVNFADKTPVFTGSNELQNLGVMKLIEFKGDLYLGTVNYQDGFTLLRTKNTDAPAGWEVISTDGLGDKSNAYTWAMTQLGDYLLMGTFNSGLYGGIYDPLPIPLDGRAQLLFTTDGLNWDTLVNDGFGEPFTYGIRNMLVSDGQLFVGTASNFFIPDFGSDLYAGLNPNFLEYLRNLLGCDDCGNFDLAQQLESFLMAGGQLDIGTQIWVTKPVPEPATILLLGAGMLGLAGYSRRKFKAN